MFYPYKFLGGGQLPPDKSLPCSRRSDKSPDNPRCATDICPSFSSENEGMSRAAHPSYPVYPARALEAQLAVGKNPGRTRGTQSELLRHSCRSLRLPNTHAPLTNVLLPAFNLRLEFLSELQFVLHHI